MATNKMLVIERKLSIEESYSWTVNKEINMKLWPVTVKKPNREAEAYNTGYQDYQLGQPIEANPYLGEEMRDAWAKGWAAAKLNFNYSSNEVL